MSRIQALNDRPARPDRQYVLYWMTAYRRLRSNFALQHAVEQARAWGKPLVMLEALRVDYPHASDRLHRFVIDGMAGHAAALDRTPVTYLPYVEPSVGAGKGLLAALGRRACLVVTDDFPAFFLPHMRRAAARQVDVRLDVVDSNGLLPMRAVDRTFTTAHSFRAYLQRTLRDVVADWPAPIDLHDLPPRAAIAPTILRRWRPTPQPALAAPETFIASLPIDHAVPPAALDGGEHAAHTALKRFTRNGLIRYAEARNDPDLHGTSGLSPYLHFGHLSSHDVFDAVMTASKWTTRKLAAMSRGAREGWWGLPEGPEAFLDQAITWRELACNHAVRHPDTYATMNGLPSWARATLAKHARDRRPWRYSIDRLRAARTHDEVWNAAQRQLEREGWMHNYLRMLWGKRILEWSASPETALDVMTAIMDALALDGRDPNSYAGYLWTLGLFDRPWGPERPIFGTVRYMSSERAKQKLGMRDFLDRYS